jgi:hypothetical protein
MRADNTARLLEAARVRSRDARTHVVAALRRLDRDGEPVTFHAVALAAGVSRSFLYRQADLRAEIDRLRQQPPTGGRPLPSAVRASNESRQARLDALRAEIARLTEENRWFRQQAETLLGERRAAPRPGEAP